MTRVYVIGSSAELERAERVIAALRERGVEITHDWTASVRAARAAGHASDATLSREKQKQIATRCIRGVMRADVVLLLWSKSPSFGAGGEWDRALWCQEYDGTPIAVSAAGGTSPHIFTSFADEIFASDDDAIEWVIGLRGSFT